MALALGQGQGLAGQCGRLAVAAGQPPHRGQVERRGPLAAVLARRGRLEAAERVAGEAVELGAGSDMLGMQAGALLDLAGVLRLAGRSGEAAPLARQALALAERKGHLVAAARARELLATAQPGGTAAP